MFAAFAASSAAAAAGDVKVMPGTQCVTQNDNGHIQADGRDGSTENANFSCGLVRDRQASKKLRRVRLFLEVGTGGAKNGCYVDYRSIDGRTGGFHSRPTPNPGFGTVEWAGVAVLKDGPINVSCRQIANGTTVSSLWYEE